MKQIKLEYLKNCTDLGSSKTKSYGINYLLIKASMQQSLKWEDSYLNKTFLLQELRLTSFSNLFVNRKVHVVIELHMIIWECF